MWSRMRWIKGYKYTKPCVPREQKETLLCTLAPDSTQISSPNFNSANNNLENEFTIQELLRALKKKDTAPGADNISYSMIYNLPPIAQLFLLNIYNSIYQSGQVPRQWREINIITIPKASTNSTPKLRPIALMSCICKIFHTMLAKRLEWFVENKCLLSPYTSGFRRGQSCLDCLTRLVTYIQIGFTNNKSTIACFLDIDSAYNNVLVPEVVKSLNRLGVGKKLCKYLWEFLKERHLNIKSEVEGEADIVRWTNKGLAQGDPLSPLIFNIVTMEIFSRVQNVMICQYADDYVFYLADSNIQNVIVNLQSALDDAVILLEKIGLEPSPNKTKLCVFSRGYKRNQHVKIKINNKIIKIEESVKYLGMVLDRSLRWGLHINYIVSKVQKTICLLKILTGSTWGVHPKHLRKLYISLIRSRIDFGSYLYDSSANTHICKLDKVQNQALRVIGGYIRSTPIHTMECDLCIPPLHLRRRYLAYKYCLKAQSWKDNPTIILVSQLKSFIELRYWQNKKKPLLISVFDSTQHENIHSSTTLLMFSPETWMANSISEKIIQINLDEITQGKSLYEPNILKNSVVSELRSKYNDFHIIYTDGSKSVQGQGAAYFDPYCKIEKKIKIKNDVSIMSLELIAISEAISYVSELNLNKVVIFSDSKSALQHLERCASGLRGISVAYLIIHKIGELIKKGWTVRLQWIPSHIGLHGNEEADRLAKLAQNEGFEIDLLPDYLERLTKYKALCHLKWREYFDLRSQSKGIWFKTMQSEPPRIPWFSNNKIKRCNIVIAHRLRSGHIPLGKFRYLMKKKDSPNCEACGKVEDVYHFLVECVKNNVARDALVNSLNINKLDMGIFLSILATPTSEAAIKIYEFARASLALFT